MGKIWAIASGSGGTGKTTLAVFLAVSAAQKGMKTILLDAAGVSRSCDLLLGIESVMAIDLTDVIAHQMDLSAALYPAAPCSGLRLANTSTHDSLSLSEYEGVILALQSMCDVLIIDLPTGEMLQNGVLTRQDEQIYMLRPDDASVRSTECLMQQMRGCEAGASLVLNHVRKDRGKKGVQYAQDAVAMMLDCPVLGAIAEDEACVLDIAAGKVVRAVQRMGSPMKDIFRQLLGR